MVLIERIIYLIIIIGLIFLSYKINGGVTQSEKVLRGLHNTLNTTISTQTAIIKELEERLNKEPNNVVIHKPKPVIQYVKVPQPVKSFDHEQFWNQWLMYQKTSWPDSVSVRNWWNDTVTHRNTTIIAEMDVSGYLHKVRWNFYDKPDSKEAMKRKIDLYLSTGYDASNNKLGLGGMIGNNKHLLGYRYYHSDNTNEIEHKIEYNIKL